MSVKRMLIAATMLALLVFSAVGIVSAQDQGTAWLGVSLLDSEDGVTIGEVVSNSPADTAGLLSGDVIVEVDGTAIELAEQVVQMIGAHAPGDEVVLSVSTDGESRDVTVALARRPSDEELLGPSTQFGFEFSGPHAMLFNLLGLEISQTDQGFEITAIAEGSPLADSGLQVGDVITQVNGELVLEPGMGMMQSFRFDEPITLTVLRGGDEVEIEIDPSTLANAMPMIQGMPGEQGMFGFGGGQGRPTQLGVQFRTLSADLAAEEELTVEQGALVVEVFEDTPAAAAGLLVDDVITAVDGDAVDEEHTLADRLYAYEEGDVVTLSVLRGEEEIELDVTLGPRMEQGQFFFGPQGQGGMMGPQGGMGPNGGMMNPTRRQLPWRTG